MTRSKIAFVIQILLLVLVIQDIIDIEIFLISLIVINLLGLIGDLIIYKGRKTLKDLTPKIKGD